MDVSASVLPELKRETYGQIQVCAKQRLARHSSFSTVQASERIQRKVNSEPSSPYKEEQGICLSIFCGIRQLSYNSHPTQAFLNKLTLGTACFFHLPEVK